MSSSAVLDLAPKRVMARAVLREEGDRMILLIMGVSLVIWLYSLEVNWSVEKARIDFGSERKLRILVLIPTA